MIGFVVGAISGIVLYFLLSQFTRSVTSGNINAKIIISGAASFFLPLVILLVIAFFLPHNLIWAGTGMAAALILSAFLRFVLLRRDSRGSGK